MPYCKRCRYKFDITDHERICGYCLDDLEIKRSYCKKDNSQLWGVIHDKTTKLCWPELNMAIDLLKKRYSEK